jgi:gliding motility-associated-like protein
MLTKTLRLISILFVFNFTVQSQVVINEYSCSNINTLPDNFNNYEDWIELYNKGNSAVNLSGYYLSDNASTPLKWQIPNGTIPAQGYFLIYASGLDTLDGSSLHTNFKLTQTKYEPIILSSSSGAFLDSIGTRPAQSDHSRGRKTDGASIWSLFTSPTPETSNTNSDIEYTARPVMNKQAGFYSGSVTVTISTSSPNTTIYYTDDGTTPNSGSATYTGPVAIFSTTVIRAVAIDNNGIAPQSFIESNTYFIDAPHLMPIVSIFGDQINTLLNGTQINPITVLEYFDKNGLFISEANGTANEHGNDSWAYDQRGIDFITRDQQGYNNAIKAKLFTIKDRKSFQRIILKAGANDNYPESNGGAHIRDSYVTSLAQLGDMYLDGRTSAFVVLYVNGGYWGVYDIREKADDSDYTEYYYDQNENNIQYLKTWGGTWSEYGGPQSQTDWAAFRSFVNANNLAIPANYNYVDSVYNVKSLTDYFILNSYVVCTDWLNWNTAWWRGLDPNGKGKKWRYALWDEDATFGHYINYTNVPSTAPTANPCNAENLPNPGGQGHTQIMKKLLSNPDFKQYYVSRYIDLTNSSLSCSYMLHVLDSMIAIIEPEMPAHVARWGGSVNQWKTNVQSLRTFITNRCVGVQTGMNSCYTLSGPYDFCVDVEPQGAGNIKINSLTLSQFPDSGKYYGGLKTYCSAIPNANYSFDHWEITSTDTIFSSSTDSSIYLKLTKDACLKAVFTTEIIPEIETTITNVFSPNGDGSNDLFVPISPIQKFNEPIELTVTDRWGKVVFKTNDLKTGWDGKNNGRDCDNGTYYWTARYFDVNTEAKVEKGFVTLVR